jgi:hypothetical protein
VPDLVSIRVHEGDEHADSLSLMPTLFSFARNRSAATRGDFSFKRDKTTSMRADFFSSRNRVAFMRAALSFKPNKTVFMRADPSIDGHNVAFTRADVFPERDKTPFIRADPSFERNKTPSMHADLSAPRNNLSFMPASSLCELRDLAVEPLFLFPAVNPLTWARTAPSIDRCCRHLQPDILRQLVIHRDAEPTLPCKSLHKLRFSP